MKPRRTVESNHVLSLHGGNEDNDLWVTIYEADARVSRDDPCFGMPCITSVWEPTPEERERIAKGENIDITIYGEFHPALTVTTTPVQLGRPTK